MLKPGLIKAGAPSFGRDPIDDHIFYYNGTPATQVFLGLDYVLPKYFNLSTVDLVMSGPNFGLNLGPFLYTISGTIGATYAAIERGIPAMAFSGGYSVQTSYQWLNASGTGAGLLDPATIYGRLSANLAQAFITKAGPGKPVLPLGYGINVNIPLITTFKDTSCANPPFILSRFTGNAVVDKAVYNETTQLFTYANTIGAGANKCINGDCSLPGETDVVTKCQSAVTFFTVDYDAPYASQCGSAINPYDLRPSIVYLANSTNMAGGLGANATVTAPKNGTSTGGTPSSTPTASRAPTSIPINATGKAQVSVLVLSAGLLAAATFL
jgi:5'-nucleotidase